MGGPLALGGHRLMGEYNNQLKVVDDGGGGVREEMRPGWNVWGGCCIFVLSGELEGNKKSKIK